MLSSLHSDNQNIRPNLSFKQKRKQDALDLAELIYDMFKEAEEGGTIDNGQNNAQTSEN